MSDPTPRPYHTQLPNLYDDAGLSVYAFRLLVHIRRVAGDTGVCWESARTMAATCRMSPGQVSTAKQELVQAGFITIGRKSVRGGFVDELRVVDVWATNTTTYRDKSDRTTITNAESDHTVITSPDLSPTESDHPAITNERSDQDVITNVESDQGAITNERSDHTVIGGDHTVIESITMDQYIHDPSHASADAAIPPTPKRKRKSDPQSPIEIREIVAKGSNIDLKTGLRSDQISVNKVAAQLWNNLRLPDQGLDAFVGDIKRCGKWIRQTQYPYNEKTEQRMPPTALIRYWPAWRASLTARSAPPDTNGTAPPPVVQAASLDEQRAKTAAAAKLYPAMPTGGRS